MSKKSSEGVFELESQFLLRVPSIVAEDIREAVRQGNSNLKERLSITLDVNNRGGTVRFDAWQLPSRVFDLPCIIETHKTLDRKTFYKTADVSQIMVCYEPGEEPKSEDEAPLRKRKDALSRKYLYPHGVTPPLKNVRKKRFRKTLKKKYIDFPEIEKEVKRLFREDNEAESVRYEVIRAEDEMKTDISGAIEVTNHPGRDPADGTSSAGAGGSGLFGGIDVGEHDLFGEPLSSSDDDEENDDGMRLDDRQMRNRDDFIMPDRETIYHDGDDGGPDGMLMNVDSNDVDSRSPSKRFPRDSSLPSQLHNDSTNDNAKDFVTQFSHGMLSGTGGEESNQSLGDRDQSLGGYEEGVEAARALESDFAKDDDVSQNTGLLERLSVLERELARLADVRRSQEEEIAAIENISLRQRFMSVLQNTKLEQAEKQREYDNIVQLLHQE